MPSEPGEILIHYRCKHFHAKPQLRKEAPVRGRVAFDDSDITGYDKRSLRKQFGAVLQSSAIISGTIKKNIALTNLPDMDKVEKAAKQAAIYDDICRMPDGFDTEVNPEAPALSGGQKQRLMIARALMNEPKVLFFDEATSALDNTTQQIVQDALNSIPVTRITVAHRLSTIVECDRILVMDQGRIVEEGSYDELMEMDGLFARFAKRNML